MHVLALAAMIAISPPVYAAPLTPAPFNDTTGVGGQSLFIPVQRRTCKAMQSCREAVIAWCNGYRGADRDRDGIPCENVCRTRAQVQAIQQEIGC